MTTPTVAQTAAAINGVRRSAKSEFEFNRFLCAIERHYGSAHLREAHALAADILMEESGAVKGADGSWYRL